MAVVEYTEDVLKGMEDFAELICQGVGPINAGIAVGWTPRKTKELLRDAAFAEFVDVAQERGIENIEQTAYELARNGNVPMIQMILFCKAPHRGWRPPQQRVAITNRTTVEVTAIEGTKAAVLEALRSGPVRELQPGNVIDAEATG